MIEKQTINGKDVWLQIEAFHVHRENPNIIPTEYFTAKYFLDEPRSENADGSLFIDDNGEAKLFESPVAALSYANKKLCVIVS